MSLRDKLLDIFGPPPFLRQNLQIMPRQHPKISAPEAETISSLPPAPLPAPTGRIPKRQNPAEGSTNTSEAANSTNSTNSAIPAKSTPIPLRSVVVVPVKGSTRERERHSRHSSRHSSRHAHRSRSRLRRSSSRQPAQRRKRKAPFEVFNASYYPPLRRQSSPSVPALTAQIAKLSTGASLPPYPTHLHKGLPQNVHFVLSKVLEPYQSRVAKDTTSYVAALETALSGPHPLPDELRLWIETLDERLREQRDLSMAIQGALMLVPAISPDSELVGGTVAMGGASTSAGASTSTASSQQPGVGGNVAK